MRQRAGARWPPESSLAGKTAAPSVRARQAETARRRHPARLTVLRILLSEPLPVSPARVASLAVAQPVADSDAMVQIPRVATSFGTTERENAADSALGPSVAGDRRSGRTFRRRLSRGGDMGRSISWWRSFLETPWNSLAGCLSKGLKTGWQPVLRSGCYPCW